LSSADAPDSGGLPGDPVRGGSDYPVRVSTSGRVRRLGFGGGRMRVSRMLVVMVLIGSLLVTSPVVERPAVADQPTEAGELLSWGSNRFAVLGAEVPPNTYNVFDVPTAILGFTDVLDVSVGEHTLVLRSDGTVWGMGRNDYGQVSAEYSACVVSFGIGPCSGGAVQVGGLSSIVDVETGRQGSIPLASGGETGGQHSLALASDGTVWAWGRNDCGQLGRGFVSSGSSLPQQVVGLSDVVDISAYETHSMALRADGTVWQWGRDLLAVDVCAADSALSATPTQVPGLANIVKISTGRIHSLAVDADGLAYGWGSHTDGAFGAIQSSDTPVLLPFQGVADVVAGTRKSLILMADGTLRFLGRDDRGESGSGQVGGNFLSVTPPLDDVVEIAMGGASSYAVTSDGSIFQWGGNVTTPQLVRGPGVLNSIAAGVGSAHAIVEPDQPGPVATASDPLALGGDVTEIAELSPFGDEPSTAARDCVMDLVDPGLQACFSERGVRDAYLEAAGLIDGSQFGKTVVGIHYLATTPAGSSYSDFINVGQPGSLAVVGVATCAGELSLVGTFWDDKFRSTQNGCAAVAHYRNSGPVNGEDSLFGSTVISTPPGVDSLGELGVSGLRYLPAEPPPPPVSSDKAIRILVLGDSYSAGNGSRNPDGSMGIVGPEDCNRTESAWSELYGRALEDDGYEVVLINRACSGSRARDFFDEEVMDSKIVTVTSVGQPQPTPEEVEERAKVMAGSDCGFALRDEEFVDFEFAFFDPQSPTLAHVVCSRIVPAQAAALKMDVDLVLLTFGGNDLDFDKIVRKCFVPAFRSPGGCRNQVGTANRDLGQVQGRIELVLQEILDKTDAQVGFLAYPYLERSDEFKVRPYSGIGRRYEAGMAVRALGRAGDVAQRAAVDSVDPQGEFITYFGGDGPGSVKAEFAGFELSAGGLDGEVWLHPPEGLIGFLNPFDESFEEEWYHPNAAGHAAEARVVGRAGDFGAAAPAGHELDVVFVVNNTASMQEDIPAFQAVAGAMFDRLTEEADSFRVAVVSYRDFPQSTGNPLDYAQRVETDFTSDRSEFLAAINNLQAAGGVDGSNSGVSALFDATTLSWRDGVAKHIIHLSDSPPGPVDPQSGAPIEADVVKAAYELDPAQIHSLVLDPTARPLADFLAEASDGLVVTSAGPEVLGADLDALFTGILQKPFAWAGGPYVAIVGDTVTFNGSGSYDVDGLIATYEWDLDGDRTYETTATGPTLTVIPDAGVRTIGLRVTDTEGNTAIGTAFLVVTIDGDSVPTATDNCPNDSNPSQDDEDGDGIGDICDPTPGFGPPPDAQPPDAADDSVELTAATISIDVLVNDSDPDGNLDPETLWIGEPPSQGEAEVTGGPNPTITYTTQTNQNDTFTYAVCDEFLACDTATVTITAGNGPVSICDGLTPTIEGTEASETINGTTALRAMTSSSPTEVTTKSTAKAATTLSVPGPAMTSSTSRTETILSTPGLVMTKSTPKTGTTPSTPSKATTSSTAAQASTSCSPGLVMTGLTPRTVTTSSTLVTATTSSVHQTETIRSQPGPVTTS